MAETDFQRVYLMILGSQTLGLDLRLDNQELRFYDPATNERLMGHAEREALRAEQLAAKLRELGVDPDDS